MKLYRRLLSYLKPYRRQIIGAILCMVIVSITNILLIPLIGKLSEAIGSRNFSLLNMVVLGAVALYFFRGVATYGQGYLTSFAGYRVVTDLRIQVYRHIQDMSLDFFSKWRTGEVISRVTNDISVVQSAVIASVMEIMPNLLTLIGVIGYLIYLNWRLTLITFLVIPLLSFIINRFGSEMREVSREAQKKAADVASILQETVSGARVVKSFAMEKHETKKFTEELEKSFGLTLKQAQINVTQGPLLAFLQVLAIVAVVWYGAYEVVSGRLSPAELISFFAGLAMIADPVSKLGTINTTIQNALASAERIFEVIDIQPSIKEKENALELGTIKGEIEFRDVSFRYDKDGKVVLKNISFSVRPGEVIALVGRSGAGKSTVVNLIPRFYDPEKGTIMIDGHDLKDLKLESLRKQMGIIPQETVLFSGTIRDNIAYSKLEASDQEVERVSQLANAHDFIMTLPDRYQTLVGERGVRVSGGERQRIAIARALLRDPRILIFDEATSSLDSESERLVQEAMQRLISGRTVFIIAHRLSTVQHADRILVIDQGEITEQGTHQELLLKNGIYKKLYEMQFQDEKNPDNQ